MPDRTPAATAGAWGVAGSYRDVFGRRQRIGSRIRRRVLDAMGIELGEPPPDRDVVQVMRPGQALAPGTELAAEDGSVLGSLARLPDDLPFGYYRAVHGDVTRLVLVPPPHCVLPSRGWGWAAQAYAARSAASWGIGDLGDLRTLAEWSAASGASFVAISPLFAANPAPEPQPSPYFATTRRFLSPLALRIEEVPGAESAGHVVRTLARRGRALNAAGGIDRARVQTLKLDALREIWERGGGRRLLRTREAAAFRAGAGAALRDWAIFAALCEQHGPGWRRWPEPYRRPDAPAVRRFAAGNADAVAFHEWVQWLADRQLAAAGGPLRLVGDLPVGVDPQGFDAWAWQDMLAGRASVGAPPDRFNTAGQDWGLPPFVPHRLRAAGYGPFVEIVRAALRHAGGLRIDHVLGLFRLWWIPRGDSPTQGAYVRYAADELLAVLAIESHRAGAFVIGEDLGTVPRGVRPRLERAGVLGTRLLYFERRVPGSWPRLALAGVTTHDLPTVAGCWTGADLADQAAAGLEPDADGLDHLRSRLAAATGLPPTADPQDVILATHRAVAASPSLLAMATLEDAMRVERRPNLPGTNNAQRDNWSAALPAPLESLPADPFVGRLVAALQR